MTRARNQQVSLDDTPYYHCISRCVRRAYLCGEDIQTGRNFDHRKRWLVERIKSLSAVFAVDVCAYAIMSNHYHLVLYVNVQKASDWDDAEVIRRWTSLFPGSATLVETLQKNQRSKTVLRRLAEQTKEWRERLQDISWFMRCLNEFVARRANREDECTGRFWEGRFKSQALLDEKALVTCMAYVDLNPVRAGLTDSLDSSDFTSIQERLITHAKKVKQRSYRQHRLLTRRSAKHLLGQSAGRRTPLKSLNDLQGQDDDAVPISQQSYFELLESTCKALATHSNEQHRALRHVEEQADLLAQLAISPMAWLSGVQAFERHYAAAAGTETSLLKFHRSRIQRGVDLKYAHKWIRGISSARQLYGT